MSIDDSKKTARILPMEPRMEKTPLLCLHCASPIPQELIRAGQTSYCCNGCRQVAQLLAELPNQDIKFQNKSIGKAQQKFFYLDQPDFKELYCFNKETNEFRIFIEGIYCAACIQILESLPKIVSGVTASELRFGESLLKIQCEPNCSLAEVAETVERMGYRPHFMLPGQSQLEKQNKENRTDIMRIGVAAAVAANIMLLAISIYSGLTGELANWFHYIEGILFSPILFFSAVPFYQGAIRGLRFGKVNIDLPITLALLLSAGFSYRSLFINSDQVYFDSTASFMFLILLSRFLLKRMQQKNSNIAETFHLFEQKGAWIQSAGRLIFKPISKIVENDLLIIHAGERIPVDGVLESHHASLDFSLMTGESTPKSLNRGMEVLAGAKSYTDQVEVRATKKMSESRVSKMMQDLNQSLSQKTPFLTKTDQYSQYLISFVLLTALLFFLYYSQFDVEAAISRSLALIVLACPCALALGAPLALSQGIKRALQSGIIIKKPQVIEKAMQARSIAFDKTGTLTLGELRLKECPLLSHELKSIILTLESSSHHPIAEAFRKTWSDIPLYKVEKLNELPGVGVSGVIDGQFFELKKTDTSLNQANSIHHYGPQVGLFKNGIKLFDFYFQDEPRSESKSLIQTLKHWGFQTFLISGDHHQSVRNIAERVGFQASEYFSNMLPKDKQNWMKAHPNTIMVGDGMNDTLGMSESGFSIAVKKSASEALEISDAYIAEANITKVLELLIIANETKKVITRNNAFALGYNIAAGTASLLGWIGPMGAAVLMPISSFVILGNSFYGTRKLRKIEARQKKTIQQIQNQAYCPVILNPQQKTITGATT